MPPHPPARAALVDLPRLAAALAASWGADTCYPPLAARWSASDPALGQCAVTALVVQDVLGGGLLFCSHLNHYWNRLPDGTELDLTASQFREGERPCPDGEPSREEVLHGAGAAEAGTARRYELLRERVERRMARGEGEP